MKIRQLITACTSVLVLGSAFSVSAFAADLTEAQAKEMAKGYIPSDSMLLRTELDHNSYDFKFYSESRKETYEIEVSRWTGKVTDFESELSGAWGSQTATITAEDAKKAVTGEIKGAEILSSVLDEDDWLKEYDVTFKTDTVYGTYEVHPQTGAVLKREIKFVETPLAVTQPAEQNRVNIPDRSSGSTPVRGSSLITPQQAKEIALSNAPGASVRKCELDYDDGIAVYEIELRNGPIEYEFEINASNGNILDLDIDHDD